MKEDLCMRYLCELDNYKSKISASKMLELHMLLAVCGYVETMKSKYDCVPDFVWFKKYCKEFGIIIE